MLSLGDLVGFVQSGHVSSGDLDAYGTPWAAVLMSAADAADDDSQTIFQTDRRNRFTSFTRTTDLPAGAGMLGSMASFNSVEPKYDAAGNCAFDGHYFYQYDAWNRLVQVNASTQGQWLPEGAAAMVMAGAGINPSPLIPGALVKHFTYDALGRLIRTQSPWPTIADGIVRSEHFYYDGIRRIQEVVVDPVRVIDFVEGAEGNETPQQLAQMANQHGGDGSAVAIAGESESPINIDGSTSTTSFEQAQMSMSSESAGGIELSNATLAREYVWGPGTSFVGAPVDELLVQVDGAGRAGWVMQDAGGDVVAVAVNTTGSGPTAVAATGSAASATGTSTIMRVAAQMEYGPYGEIIWAEHLLNHPALHLGHKGLFVDRLDVGVADNSAGTGASAKTFGETPRVVPLAFNLAQNRNRVLNIPLQRYLQQDPNATGLSAIASIAMNGQSGKPGMAMFEIEYLYRPGSNLYDYLNASPFGSSDPLGLFPGEYAINLGIGVAQMGAELVGIYSDNLSDDVDWATDWSQPDDAYSRLDNSWVSEVMNRHVNSMVNDQLGLLGFFMPGGGGDGPAMAGIYSGTSFATDALKIGGKAARRLLQLHHALPRYIAKALSKESKILIRMPEHLHRLYHKSADDAIRSLGAPAMNRGAQELERWINRYPELAQARAAAVVETLRTATTKFSSEHKLTGLSEALEEALGLMD